MGNRVNAYEIINSNYDGASQNLFIYTSNNFINYSDNDGFSAIEATGLLEVEKNGATHYSVKPKNAPVSAWISMGSSSIWTFAIRNICIKWDGEIKNERYR